ncbi:dTDP-4-dehydrorhamnose reductase [Maribacter sp. ANRC-HE7]|uniref:dTDP-4-dehydrorhamnose reductase n=1 Tax=Maribacter aquimaris TaxID=2737171 RepID=A0ABR7UWN0_9FLAO|nr:dTDP-4-dehydrorhamnose reductase [Maribacter aquimaris]MBD0776937.1 dTDP-4-dehydrorhamnose reductase [Maribacter aquimaris]
MLRVLVTGGSGQLGKCIREVASDHTGTLECIYKSSKELDISDKVAVFKEFENGNYHFCINTAAYTNVDGAEKDQMKVDLVNHVGPENLAEACDRNDMVLIHISTDFVFDGARSEPYSEKDKTNPLGEYGKSKLKGELAVQSLCQKHFIIRTSWLYSEYGSNFLKSMLKYGRERESLSVVYDQIGTPTYAKDLAEVILLFVLNKIDAYGVYHYSNEGVASWYDFAKAIFDINDVVVQLLPIRTEAYPLPAKRPSFSVLDTSKIKNVLQIEIPYWRDSLKRACDDLGHPYQEQ